MTMLYNLTAFSSTVRGTRVVHCIELCITTFGWIVLQERADDLVGNNNEHPNN
jgi:hypothetical protein